MFKSRFKGKEIKIMVYAQYLLNYEIQIKAERESTSAEADVVS